MFLVRRFSSSKRSLTLQLIQEHLTNPRNVAATPFSYGNKFSQQRFCSSKLQQQPSGEMEDNKCKKHALGRIEGKLNLMFTCKKCSTNNNKFISKLGYEKGVVIVRCDGCKNNHLIADNLGWFPHLNNKTNIEHILKHKGETVRRLPNDGGFMEFVTKEVLFEVQKQQNLNESLEEKQKLELEVKLEHQKAGTSVDQEKEDISRKR